MDWALCPALMSVLLGQICGGGTDGETEAGVLDNFIKIDRSGEGAAGGGVKSLLI